MAKTITLLFLVVMVNVFAVLAMASEVLPSPSPSVVEEVSSMNRKLGLHRLVEQGFHDIDRPSPSLALQHNEGSAHLTGEGEPAAVESMNIEAINLETKEIHLKKHHGSVDKSVAGGAVILGCLAIVFLGTVFCYIKATGKAQKQDSASSAA